jgi:hypothetical protein
MRELKTRSSIYRLRDDGIIVQVNLPNVTQTIEDAKENIAAFHELAAGHPHPLLVDTRSIHSMGPGVREMYSGSEAMRFTSAIAVLTNTSGPGRVIANLFISLGAPKAPTRLFGEEADAVAWLLKITRAMRNSRG